MRHSGKPDVSLEMLEPFPGTTRQVVGPLQTGDADFDSCSEVAQLAVHPRVLGHGLDGPSGRYGVHAPARNDRYRSGCRLRPTHPGSVRSCRWLEFDFAPPYRPKQRVDRRSLQVCFDPIKLRRLCRVTCSKSRYPLAFLA